MNDFRSRIAKLSAAASRLKQTAPIAGPFNLALLTDERMPRAIDPVVRLLPQGSAVIFRNYDAPDRQRRARRLAALCAARSILFYVAGDSELARRLGADGVHLPSRNLDRRLCTDGLLVSAACHTAEEIKAAEKLGAHSIFLSPVFPTKSHPGAEYLGREDFARLASAASIPVIALGGVNAGNAERLLGTGAAGIGAIDGFFTDAVR